jgi:uncharacterized protein (DUF2236 family)
MTPVVTGWRGSRDDERITWKLHREVVLLLGWGRAILLQVAHPLVARGVADHSTFERTPGERWRRLSRTVRAMLALTFDPDGAGRGAIERINAIHDRVHGRLGEAAGGFGAGTPYSAHDPHLLRWVHATLVDSQLLAYQLYVGHLAPAERDRYCRESSEIEPLLGIPPNFLPRDVAALRAYLDRMLGSGEIVVTDVARALARELLTPPLPRLASPLVRVMRLPAIGLLPAPIRTAYGFPWTPRDEAALHRSAAVLRRLLPLVPPPVRHWRAARRAARRARRPV